VADMNTTEGYHDPKRARIYHAAAPVQAYPVSLAIHTRGDPESFGPRLRALAVDVDPALRIYEPTPMDALNRADLVFLRFWFRLVLAVSAIALLLSLSGIYSVMAFTVSRRTREIGIRVALGSGRRGVVLAILRRPLLQVTAGLLFGLLLSSVLLGLATSERSVSLQIIAQLAAYGAAMLGICMLACIVPAKHALRVQPSEAMRAEG